MNVDKASFTVTDMSVHTICTQVQHCTSILLFCLKKVYNMVPTITVNIWYYNVSLNFVQDFIT